MGKGIYQTIESASKGLYKEKGSKFLSFAYPVNSEDEVQKIISDLKKQYHDARHHCYAYLLDDTPCRSRAFDDGEPKNSAGQPILGQIRSKRLINTLVVVVRYFGGTLLGVGGLMHAYKTAAGDALTNASIITQHNYTVHELRFMYEKINDIMKVIKEEKLLIRNQELDNQCRIEVAIPDYKLDKVVRSLGPSGCRIDERTES